MNKKKIALSVWLALSYLLILTPPTHSDARDVICGFPFRDCGYYQRQVSIRRFLGLSCNGTYCPGWQLLDNNPATVQIAASGGNLYKLHNDGRIWRWAREACNGNFCPGWELLDNNAATIRIAADGSNLYQMHNNGRIWQFTGVICSGEFCPGWRQLDNNGYTKDIITGGGQLYQLHKNGRIWQFTGTACSGEFCPGWRQLDNNPKTVLVTADEGGLYQMHDSKEIWRFTGVACTGEHCPGWEMIDRNRQETYGIRAGSGRLHQLRRDGSIWWFDGTACSGDYCPGWVKLDNSDQTYAFTGGGGHLYQMRHDGSVQMFTGSGCGGNACPYYQWELIDGPAAAGHLPSSAPLVADGSALYQLHVDAQCGAECKLNTMTSVLNTLDPAHSSPLWQLETNHDAQIFSSPRPWDSDLKKPGRDLLDAVQETIKDGTKLIDITTLDYLGSEWVQAIGKGLKEVEDNAAKRGSAPVVRIHLGISGLGFVEGLFESNWDDHLKLILRDLTAGLAGNSGMAVYISGGRRTGLTARTSWNHSKIVAVDGREAIVGGHNLWPMYLDALPFPVFDTSVKIVGDSALSAHRFADELWRDHRDFFPPYDPSPFPGPDIIPVTPLPPAIPHLFLWQFNRISTVAHLPSHAVTVPQGGGSLQVLGVGQLSKDYTLNPLQTTVQSMVNSATESILISQQSLWHPYYHQWWFSSWLLKVLDRDLVLLLAKDKAIRDDVRVTIVLSNVDAGWSSTVSNEKLLSEIWSEVVKDGVERSDANRRKLCRNLAIVPLRIATFPDLAATNHSKTIMVDRQVVMIGSHNLYSQDPAQHSEYSYVIADAGTAETYYRSYWEPVLRASAHAAVSEASCLSLLN